MRLTSIGSAAVTRSFVAGLLACTALVFTTPTAARQAPPTRTFDLGAGLVLHYVKADKASDFEMIMNKVKEALNKSDKPERKQQAAGWKVYKSPEPGPGGSTIYAFVVDPAPKGVDYFLSSILSEGFPTEAQALYETYNATYVDSTPKQVLLNLQLVASMGQ